MYFQNNSQTYILVVSFLVQFLNECTLCCFTLYLGKRNPFSFQLHYIFLTWTAQWKDFLNLMLAFKKYLVCTIWNCKLNYFGGDLKWVSSTYKLVLEPKGACSQYILQDSITLSNGLDFIKYYKTAWDVLNRKQIELKQIINYCNSYFFNIV